MAREVTTSDSYLELVSKLIPGEIVAVYLAVQSLLVGLDQRVTLDGKIDRHDFPGDQLRNQL